MWITVQTRSGFDAEVTDEDCELVAHLWLWQVNPDLFTRFSSTVLDLMLAGF